jgi:hypothetical protein
MPSKLELTPLSETEVKKMKGVPAAPILEVKWPKKDSTAAEAREALKTSQDKLSEPKAPENPPIKIEAAEPTAAALSRLVAVLNSEDAHVEILRQKFDEGTFIGTFYSAFLAHRYMEAQGKIKAGDPQQAEIVKAFQAAYAAAGLRGVTEAKLSQYAKQIAANREVLNAMTKMVNGAQVLDQAEGKGLAAGVAKFMPATAKIIVPPFTNIIPNLCAGPIVQGTFTKHLSGGFSLSFGFNAPCIPQIWKTCWYGFTIVANYSLDLTVGYKVNCCGATVWGQAVAQACVSALGHTACANVTGTIVGVAGVTKSPAPGGKCNYGLGIVASLQATFAGQTLLSTSVSFGYLITGAPCPPPGLPC